MSSSPSDIVEAADTYLRQGYSHDYRLVDGEIRDITAGRTLDAAQLHVDAAYRFEIEPNSDDASNFYAITDRGHGAKGLLIDAFDMLGPDSPSPLLGRMNKARRILRDEQPSVPIRYGVRKVGKSEFEENPERYVLRIDFPDFPPCPFGAAFSMLGFDVYEQAYVWLATKILKDERLIRVPYQDAVVDDNE